jgi:hypothetical protein
MKFINIFSRQEDLQQPVFLGAIIIANRVAVGVLLCCLLLLLSKLL